MEQSKEVLLEIKDYTVEFHTETGVKQAINHLNLTIHKGESLGLVGEAGAGKTTTALSILRLLPKHSAKIKGGTITFGGQNMAKLSQRELRDIRGSKISMICAWMVTSKAVVGSSAINSSGLQARAAAMPMRWRMPPEN